MGFPTSLVNSDEGHYSEFVCRICLQLAEYPVLTVCSHVFCRSCLEGWATARLGSESGVRCPSCNSGLADAGKDLRQASPLAWRLFGRVRVGCPLAAAQGCAWNGEYSDHKQRLL